MQKEKENGKRDLPPTPPIEKREREKEEHHTTPHAGARAREGIVPPVIDIHTPPSLKLLLAFAECRHYTDTKYVREWYDLMTNELFWCHPMTGEPLRHWPAYFRACYNAHERSNAGTFVVGRKADNWRGTEKGAIGNVLG